MIEEQFVSFDTARMLKEAGFDVPCRGVYVTDRTGYYEFREYDNKQTTDDLCWNSADGFQYEYLAPTQALAARWLREIHKLHIFAKRIYDYSLLKYRWSYWIQNAEYDIYKDVEIGFYSYEEAMEAGFQKAVKLIKK